MAKNLEKCVLGYKKFRDKFLHHDAKKFKELVEEGQHPEIMIVACSDSRVDPTLILQSEPGELFVVRNVANIVPPFGANNQYDSTSAALEFGICYLKIKHLILFGHSHCGGIAALTNKSTLIKNDFISNWVSILKLNNMDDNIDQNAKNALCQSYQNCFSFPWLKNKLDDGSLILHRWFFDIKSGTIAAFNNETQQYEAL